MIGRTSPDLSLTPDKYLAGLETFLTETAYATSEQRRWLEFGRGLMSAEQAALYDANIAQQINENVAEAGGFIQELGVLGLALHVRHPDGDCEPLAGIGFKPDTCQYALGVISPVEGPTLLPFNDANQLEIRSNFRG